MNFNSMNELLNSNSEAQEFFNSLDAATQKELLDEHTEVINLDELKSYANVIKNDL